LKPFLKKFEASFFELTPYLNNVFLVFQMKSSEVHLLFFSINKIFGFFFRFLCLPKEKKQKKGHFSRGVFAFSF